MKFVKKSGDSLLNRLFRRGQSGSVLPETGEERYRNLFNTIDEGFCIVQVIFNAKGSPVDYRFLEVNTAFEKQTGLHGAEGKLMRELARAHEEHWFQIYGKVALTGEPAHFMHEARALNRWFDVHAFRVGRPENRQVAIVFNDISRLKQAEKALRESEFRYRTIADYTYDFEFWLDPEGRYLYASPSCKRINGHDPAEFLANHELRRNIVHPDDLAHFDQHTAHEQKELLPGEVEYRILCPDGTHRWISHVCQPVFDEQGRYLGIRGSNRDITKRRQTEEALRDTNAQKQTVWYIRNLIEVSLDPLVTISAYGKITDVNEATIKATGVSREDLIGTNFSDYFTEPEKANQGYRQVFDQGSVTDYPLILRHKNGTLMHVLYNASVYKDESGKVLGIFAAARDVTAQRQAAWYTRSLIEASLDPLVTISANGKITDVNEATVKATGVPKDGLIGTDFFDYFTEPEKASIGYRQVFDQGSVTDYPLTIRHKSGTLMDVLYNAVVYRDIDGNVLGVFAAARDVTVRKRTEEELAVYRRHLEELVAARTAELRAANEELHGSRRAALNLLKDAMEARRAAEQAENDLRRIAEDLARSNKDLEQFAYVASHDLQEPLRAVGGFMGLLKNQYHETLDGVAKEYIDLSIDGAERMQRLIHALLAYSRVGTQGKAFEPISLKDAVDQALRNLHAAITQANARIFCESLPTLRADPAQMTQLMQNLIGNAIKFHGSPNPEIRISAERKDRNWVVSVSDNGIGIEPQYFDRIFLIFQRLHSRTQYEGTGIGLAICKRIVERHGGSIWVESKAGQGSTFCFTIPYKGGNE